MTADEGLVKILIEAPDEEDGVTCEAVWAAKVGKDVYEVRNSPWFTQEINFKDVVRAIAPDEDQKPVFQEVVRRGGHRSIHVIFFEEGMEKKDEILATVKGFGAGYEGMDGAFFAINLPPSVDFDLVADYLQEYQDQGWLEQSYAPQPQPKGTQDIVH